MKEFTYYCGVHFWEVKKAPAPSVKASSPCCPICNERMYWVPNGGTQIPTEQSPEE